MMIINYIKSQTPTPVIALHDWENLIKFADSDNDEGPKETIASDDEEAPERQYGKTGLESSDEEDDGDNSKPAPTGFSKTLKLY